jgi:hydrogenase expression/formation protein HypD
MAAILAAPGCRVQGFLAAGHVATVAGYRDLEPLAERFRIPITVTGFEPLDLLEGVLWTVRALEEGRWGVENQYRRSVARDGNHPARRLLAEVFAPCDRAWRGLGPIPASGYRLREPYAAFDAERRFAVESIAAPESPLCRAGEVLQGHLRPPQCPAFGRECSPERPLGAPMVSSEGACAAYHRYGRFA